jgi:hypothetical protein
MNEKDIIQALKDNEKPFGLMSEVMQAKAKEVGGELQKFALNGWENLNRPNGQKMKFVTYRLRPDYEPEPEIVECDEYPIKPNGQGKLYFHDPVEDYTVGTIADAANHSDFIGFKYEGNRISIMPRIYASENLYEDLIKADTLEKHEVLTPIAVLFRKEQK